MKDECKKGNHHLITILCNRHSWDESEEVARWCPDCGAIVVDLDYDGRTQSGRGMGMRLPMITMQKISDECPCPIK